jgi:CRP/FNR family transcriptional regulator
VTNALLERITLPGYSFSSRQTGTEIVKSTTYDSLHGNNQDFLGATSGCEQCVREYGGICASLESQDIERLARISHPRTFSAGQIILVEGANAEFFGTIMKGVVKLTKTLADGRQHIVGLLFPGDFLGRVFREENKYYAEAATNVELCCFPRVGFEKLLRECPGLEDCLFRLVLNELDACQEWMLLLGRKCAEERVASFLLMIARRAMSSADKNVQFLLPLARSDIADCLGLTIETVSRQITRLKSRNIIELVSNREILVPNLAVLEEAANGRIHTSFD